MSAAAISTMTEKRVLVVEDEEPIRDLLRFRLGRAGYEVVPAATGAEARAAIADTHPDVIVMDWMLPDVSGLELTKQLKRDPATRDIPVIMVTARAQEDDRVRSEEHTSELQSRENLVCRLLLEKK